MYCPTAAGSGTYTCVISTSVRWLVAVNSARSCGSNRADMARKEVIAEHQHVHTRAQKTIERLARLAHDRLVFVERSVEQDRDLGALRERANQRVVARVLLRGHRLQPARPIHVCDRRDARALCFADLEHLHHEGHGRILFEPLVHVLAQNRRCEWAKGFAAFDLLVQDLLHIAATRIAEDRAISERARTPLHAPLKPADHLALRDLLRDARAQRGRVGHMLCATARALEVAVALRDGGLDLAIAVLRTPVRV